MKFLKLLFPFFLILIGSVLLYFQFLGPLKNIESERFVIRLNTSEEQIVDDLKEKGFIKNKKIFSLILEFVCWQKKTCPESLDPVRDKLHRRIQPGAYNISKSMNAYEIAQVLSSGPYQKWVTIPPGKRKEQAALILQKALDWSYGMARNFTNVAQEGYLYPDTYLINVDADPQQIIEKLRANFNEKFNSQLQKDLLSQNIRNDTALKIASLIERESGGNEDKPIIAGIIWNRLNKGIKLEIDATVQYAIASEKLDDTGLQSLEGFDFWPFLGPGLVRKVESPYNTYLIKALPPGPICSPSIESMRAVAYPAQTDALYYLHSQDKQIHTAKTFKEHQENIVKYLKN